MTDSTGKPIVWPTTATTQPVGSKTLFSYRLLVQVDGTEIVRMAGADPRPPADLREAWIRACNAMAERKRQAQHLEMVANMRNGRVGKRLEDGMLEEIGEEDVVPPPQDMGRVEEQLCLAGREDGSGYVSVVAGLVLGIECTGRVE